jgi:tetratricopeptide (TPR) repeat protein
MTAEWFRQTTWSDAAERAFEAKLGRARRKAQYLRIQACTLAQSEPAVALKLLDRYFQLGEDFDLAQAHVDRATAFLALGEVSAALNSYEAALAREAVFPNLQTEAYIALPFLVATRGIQGQFSRALELLRAGSARLMFPVDHFRWHAAQALIAAAGHDSSVAPQHARRALEAAASTDSGFRRHPSVGLVTRQYDGLLRELAGLAAA